MLGCKLWREARFVILNIIIPMLYLSNHTDNSLNIEQRRLGIGDTSNRGDGSSEMGDFLPEVQLGTGWIPIKLVSGAHHTCAISQSQEMKCWGQLIYSLSIFMRERNCVTRFCLHSVHLFYI